ncbi:CRR6 family NdhI maturation factor [Synechococcus elongatus]|uniref:CRR6 family NdhI maturation factor n=1 Tax=Synechococcus elongatus TaxID=32046 RepID=UPI000F7F2C87|nr:CRR6 family NdhI maturation factor [Synechococcus elongatus]
MSRTLVLPADAIAQLDLSPVQTALPELKTADWLTLEQQVSLEIQWPRSEDDPRELAEIPEIRLWFIRLDATYPQFPLLVNWQSGELVRYAAMLVPHQFSRNEGLQFNPEALAIWVNHKIFYFAQQLADRGLSGSSRLKNFAQILGFEIDESFFELL